MCAALGWYLPFQRLTKRRDLVEQVSLTFLNLRVASRVLKHMKRNHLCYTLLKHKLSYFYIINNDTDLHEDTDYC